MPNCSSLGSMGSRQNTSLPYGSQPTGEPSRQKAVQNEVSPSTDAHSSPAHSPSCRQAPPAGTGGAAMHAAALGSHTPPGQSTSRVQEGASAHTPSSGSQIRAAQSASVTHSVL